jgi:hypothetical protein
MPYTNYFHPGPPDPTDLPALTLRKIEGHWHVVATEPGHCEHVHGEGFLERSRAEALLARIRGELEAGRRLDIVRSWETRVLAAA